MQAAYIDQVYDAAAALEGNAGTGMRLLAGLLAGQAFDTELVGDASLSKARPMACGRLVAFAHKDTTRTVMRLDAKGTVIGHLPAPDQQRPDTNLAELRCVGSFGDVLVAANADPRDIAAGVLKSIATRMASMLGRRAAGPVLLTGGVARVAGMGERLAEALGCAVRLAEYPEYTGALGAALLAAAGPRG